MSAPGHLIILSGLNSGLLAAMLTLDGPGITHWAMPLLILNLLILPLRQGMALSFLLLVPTAGVVLFQQPTTDAIIAITGLAILLAAASLYIWHYDHMAQSAEDLAITDPVTGAHNARFLDETLQKRLAVPLPPDISCRLSISVSTTPTKRQTCTARPAFKHCSAT